LNIRDPNMAAKKYSKVVSIFILFRIYNLLKVVGSRVQSLTTYFCCNEVPNSTATVHNLSVEGKEKYTKCIQRFIHNFPDSQTLI
jgi:hypothetical protein